MSPLLSFLKPHKKSLHWLQTGYTAPSWIIAGSIQIAEMPFYGIERLLKTGNDIRTSEWDLTRTLSFQSRERSKSYWYEATDNDPPPHWEKIFIYDLWEPPNKIINREKLQALISASEVDVWCRYTFAVKMKVIVSKLVKTFLHYFNTIIYKKPLLFQSSHIFFTSFLSCNPCNFSNICCLILNTQLHSLTRAAPVCACFGLCSSVVR